MYVHTTYVYLYSILETYGARCVNVACSGCWNFFGLSTGRAVVIPAPPAAGADHVPLGVLIQMKMSSSHVCDLFFLLDESVERITVD